MSAPFSMEASEILTHLNHLGYRNITADQLKEFQKDLRKLIKFDTRLENYNHEEYCPAAESIFERLHSENTISYQAKVIKPCKKREISDSSDKENKTIVANAIPHKDNNKPSKMWIRTKNIRSARRGDPVALYHAYQKDWNKFKHNLPGENDHSELRWKIRNRLMGE